MTSKEQLNNAYVRGYYNKQIGNLNESYTHSRWVSSPARVFDYIQTKRALGKALGVERYGNVVEVGPGDAVWTEEILKHVDGSLHLIEQSDEMLMQAKERLTDVSDVTFERSDFMDAQPPKENDLIVAMRCFEYFLDKQGGLKKMFNTLKPGGRLVIVTKNSDLYTTKNVQNRTFHSAQLSKNEMINLLQSTGFVLESVYPATLRWKIKYAPSRLIFDALHKLSVKTLGRFSVPILFKYATESYTYVAVRPK